MRSARWSLAAEETTDPLVGHAAGVGHLVLLVVSAASLLLLLGAAWTPVLVLAPAVGLAAASAVIVSMFKIHDGRRDDLIAVQMQLTSSAATLALGLMLALVLRLI